LAIDVIVKAPATAGCEGDCVEEGRREKMKRYGPYLGELAEQGIRFAPASFSALGRWHPEVEKMLVIASQKAARLRGGGDASWWSKKWKRDLSATLWARAATMVTKCVNLTQQVEAADQWNAVRAQMEEEEGNQEGVPKEVVAWWEERGRKIEGEH
jgi:hypothetical protein